MFSNFIGCGALNWDIFFEVENFQEIKYKNITIFPGREIILNRKEFLEFLEFLEKKGKKVYECGGGSASNTIYALSSWGFNSIFIGAVGEDTYGKKVLAELEKAGINTEFIIKKGETSLALIILDKNKDRFIAVSPGNSENFLKDLNIPYQKIEGIFHFSSYASKSGQDFQKKFLQNINSKISFDPGEIYVNLGKDFLMPWLKKTKFLFITKYELERLSLSFNEAFLLGIELIFLKKGKGGAGVCSSEEKIELSSFLVKKIIDNTGAGDYFDAGVLAGLKLGYNKEKALKLGIYSAGISLRDYGRKGILTKEEFQNYINLLK